MLGRHFTQGTQAFRKVIGAHTYRRLTKDVLHFLYSLRALLRQYPHGCASITLSPHLLLDNGVGSAFLQKVGWLADACLSLAAFSCENSALGIEAMLN